MMEIKKLKFRHYAFNAFILFNLIGYKVRFRLNCIRINLLPSSDGTTVSVVFKR